MTKVACLIILRIGVVRHLWKSIKSLRRASKSESGSLTPNCYQDILEVWSLIGLHSLYVTTGSENFLQYLPFYYYFKMFGLIGFFFLPSASNQNVFAQYLFEHVLVRGVDHIHEFLNIDYLGWTKRQIYILPWRILDLVIPGMLGYSSLIGKKECRRRRIKTLLLREEQLLQSKEKIPYQSSQLDNCSSILDENDSIYQKVIILTIQPEIEKKDSEISAEKTNVSPSSVSPKKTSTSTSPKTKASSSRKSRGTSSSPVPSGSAFKRSSSSIFSPIAQSRVQASSMHLRNFSKNHKQKRSSFPLVRETKSSRLRAAQRNSSPTKRPFSLSPKFSSRQRMPKTPPMPPTPSLPEREEQESITKSPIEDSSSKDTSAVPISTRVKKAIANLSIRSTISSISLNNILSYLTAESVGNAVRKIITGNTQIRLRDFLFDLDLPMTPRPYLNNSSKIPNSEPIPVTKTDELKISEKNNDNNVEKPKPKQKKHVFPISMRSKNRRKTTGDILHRKSTPKRTAKVSNSNNQKKNNDLGFRKSLRLAKKLDFDQEISEKVRKNKISITNRMKSPFRRNRKKNSSSRSLTSNASCVGSEGNIMPYSSENVDTDTDTKNEMKQTTEHSLRQDSNVTFRRSKRIASKSKN